MASNSPPDRDWSARQIVIDLSVLACIGVVLGLLAPLGTGYMSLAERIAYWVVLAMAGYLFYKPLGAIMVGKGAALDLPLWFLWPASVLVASIPMAITVWLVNSWGGPVRVPSLEIGLTHYGAVCVVGAVVTLLFNLLPATASPPASASEPVSPGKDVGIAPPLADHLPPHLGSEIVALEMEDHYVRVHTAIGSELVLMRLRDAMAQLDGLEGLQVHRSWWVARDAVEDIVTEGRKVRLILAREIEAPVSRAKVSELKDAGWL